MKCRDTKILKMTEIEVLDATNRPIVPQPFPKYTYVYVDFLKMGQPLPLFRLLKQTLQYLQQINQASGFELTTFWLRVSSLNQ